MNKRKKRFIFFVALVAFFTISPLVVLFAKGARLDFDSREIDPTGGIYLKVHTSKDFNVFLEGKKEGTTPLFISGLSPGSYLVETKKEGFKAWEKKLCVRPFRVTKARNIYFIPETPQLKEFNKDKDFRKYSQQPSKERLDFGYRLVGEGSKKLYLEKKKETKTSLLLEDIDNFRLGPSKDKAYFELTSGKMGVIWLVNNYWFNKDKGEIDFFNFNSSRRVQWLEDGLHLAFQKEGKLYLKRVAFRSNCEEKDSRPTEPRLLLQSVDDFWYKKSADSLFVKKEDEWLLYDFD